MHKDEWPHSEENPAVDVDAQGHCWGAHVIRVDLPDDDPPLQCVPWSTKVIPAEFYKTSWGKWAKQVAQAFIKSGVSEYGRWQPHEPWCEKFYGLVRKGDLFQVILADEVIIETTAERFPRAFGARVDSSPRPWWILDQMGLHPGQGEIDTLFGNPG